MTKMRPSNPFHPEAVATYGQVIRTCENLGYMGTALEQLTQYLINYPSAADRRYGAAIGLRGGHGSGKTHLLMWLAEKAKNLSTIQPIVLYAKADRASFADLYTQLLSNLSREKFQELLGEALKNLAQEEVGKAKASEILDQEISSAADLERLSSRGKIDLEQLVKQLQIKLDSARSPVPGVTPDNPVPGVIPRTLTLINDPKLGDKAYQWLIGRQVTGLADLNLSYHLFELKPTEQAISKAENSALENTAEGTAPESSVPDVTAVNGLETVAALLQLTERPLVVLIDQFEVLLRADSKRQQTLFSVIKKLVEQLNLQNALTFIAGNNEPWEALTPDVTPRLRMRDPLLVGNLSLEETEQLLGAYTDVLDCSFSDEALGSIHNLSGGNPREIIRIAYYAYEDRSVDGDLNKVDEEVLVRSAGESRTVEERNKLALARVDAVLGEFAGAIRANINIEADISLDRMLVANDQPRLALMMMKATDKLAEIDSARRHQVVLRYLGQKWPSVPLISVSVGYSSSEVADLIGTTSAVLQFDEKDFPGQLRATITELLAKPRPQETNSTNDLAVLEVLKTIAERLNMLETERTEETNQIAERFSTGTGGTAEPSRKERETGTRWDMVNALDQLQDGLREGDSERERGIMKSLLVANEANLRIKQIDYLGGLYLELLAEVPPWDGSDRTAFSRKLLTETRTEVIRELRRLLRGKRVIDSLVEQPRNMSVVAASLIGFVATVVMVLLRTDSFGTTSFALRLTPVLLVTTGLAIGLTYLLRWRHLIKWERVAAEVREQIRISNKEKQLARTEK